jgi:hypothetical protein
MVVQGLGNGTGSAGPAPADEQHREREHPPEEENQAKARQINGIEGSESKDEQDQANGRTAGWNAQWFGGALSPWPAIIR